MVHSAAARVVECWSADGSPLREVQLPKGRPVSVEEAAALVREALEREEKLKRGELRRVWVPAPAGRDGTADPPAPPPSQPPAPSAAGDAQLALRGGGGWSSEGEEGEEEEGLGPDGERGSWTLQPLSEEEAEAAALRREAELAACACRERGNEAFGRCARARRSNGHA